MSTYYYYMLDVKNGLSEINKVELNKIFKENNISFILLAPDQGFNITQQDFASEYNDHEYIPPRSLIDETNSRIKNLIERSEKEGFTFFDDTLGRVDDVSIQANKLLIRFSKTRYFQFAALNKGLDLPLSDVFPVTLREFLNEDPYDLLSSRLPNPLGIVTSLILEPENKLVLTIHSNRNFEGSGLVAAPIGGSLSIKAGDINDLGSPDPFSTVAREAYEELGIKIGTSDIKFFGCGRELTTLKPEIIGEIFLDLKEKEFLQIQKAHAKDAWEIERQFIADRNEILNFLSMKNWSPPAWAVTYLSIRDMD
jgi:8-oxo-dGTP pyrophosphatase MutT (NUDIX family)